MKIQRTFTKSKSACRRSICVFFVLGLPFIRHLLCFDSILQLWSGYHCLHGMAIHHAKNYEKYNCRHASEGPFPLTECSNQCRIGHFGKGRWALHPYANWHYTDGDYVDGSDYLNGKGPAPVQLQSDGSDYVDAAIDYLDGKGSAPVQFQTDGSDYLDGKGPAPVGS